MQSLSPSVNYNFNHNNYASSNQSGVPSSGDGYHSATAYNNKTPSLGYMNAAPSYSNNSLASLDSFRSGIEQPMNNESEQDYEKVVEHIATLRFSEKREEALQELSKKRESIQSLARLLWGSVGTVAIL